MLNSSQWSLYLLKKTSVCNNFSRKLTLYHTIHIQISCSKKKTFLVCSHMSINIISDKFLPNINQSFEKSHWLKNVFSYISWEMRGWFNTKKTQEYVKANAPLPLLPNKKTHGKLVSCAFYKKKTLLQIQKTSKCNRDKIYLQKCLLGLHCLSHSSQMTSFYPRHRMLMIFLACLINCLFPVVISLSAQLLNQASFQAAQ